MTLFRALQCPPSKRRMRLDRRSNTLTVKPRLLSQLQDKEFTVTSTSTATAFSTAREDVSLFIPSLCFWMIFRICPIYPRASFLSHCNTNCSSTTTTRRLSSLPSFHARSQPAKTTWIPPSICRPPHPPFSNSTRCSPIPQVLTLKPIRGLHISSRVLHQDKSSSVSMSTNGEARPKRRSSPISAIERPKKQLKQENGVPTPGDATPQNGSVFDVEGQPSSVPILNSIAAAGDSPEWQATIEKVIKSVVSIHFCQTCSFDTDLSTSSQATGFVVDAENGYILTNRHVVCSGPFWGYCVFDNHEEVSELPVL